MTNPPEPVVRALAPTAVTKAFGRRGFLAGLGGAVALPLLAACGSSSSSTANAAPSGGGSTQLESTLSIYTWGAYDDPKTFTNYTAALGPAVTIDSYSSNQEMIAKLVAAKGTSGYDIVVPTGPYIPEMISNKLLMTLDHSKLPNLSNVDPQFLAKDWDPQNQYSVCKDWGTTGFVYDTTKITRSLTSWADFLDAAQNEAAGQTAVLDVPEDLVGMYFWANGIDWNTTSQTDLDAAQSFLTSKIAKNIKAFDSYPGSGGAMPKGTYTLMQAWNGDARQGLQAAKNPSQYKWVLPTPATELWMDNWSITANAPHPNAAHAFINYVLDTKNSLREVEFMGYNSGIKNIEPLAVAAKTEYLDMIFYTPAQVATMKTGVINEATQTKVNIMNTVKAAAAA
jgi:spermidine/putrescine transport system substrate-binding protein